MRRVEVERMPFIDELPAAAELAGDWQTQIEGWFESDGEGGEVLTTWSTE